jgi:hypothetical protein
LEYLIEITTADGVKNIMNPIKAGEVAATIAEAVAPETTKIAESAAQKLLEAGGIAGPQSTRAIGIDSLGGELPADLPKSFGNGAADFQITTFDKPISNIYDHEMLPGHEQFGLRAQDVNNHEALHESYADHWTPAVQDMMRRVFLKTEG